MGEELGAEVDLDKVPLKYAGLNYTEIWISEAQERMVIAVKPENLDAIMKIFAGENVEATVIGKFTGDKKLKLRYKGHCRRRTRYGVFARWRPQIFPKSRLDFTVITRHTSRGSRIEKNNYNEELLAILAHTTSQAKNG